MRQLLRLARRRYISCEHCLLQDFKPTLRLSCDCSQAVYPSIHPTTQVARYRTVFSTVNEGQKHDQPVHESGPTIYALSTAPGRAAIAVVRISGPRCLQVRYISYADVKLAKRYHVDIPIVMPGQTFPKATICDTALAL